MQATSDLLALIRAAWACARRPAPEHISCPTYDDEGVSAYFAGKTWEGHTARQLRVLDFAPCIFTQEAFAYYLPAYLVADLEDPETSDTNMERVLFWLERDNVDASARPDTRVIDRLTPLQRSALKGYVLFVQRRELGLYADECTAILRHIDDADRCAGGVADGI